MLNRLPRRFNGAANILIRKQREVVPQQEIQQDRRSLCQEELQREALARFTKWGPDDYLVMVSLVFIILMTTMTQLMTAVGLGCNTWTLNDDEITRFYIYILIVEFGYLLSLCLVKLSILYFFLRTFPHPGFRTVVKWTIGFTILVSMIYGICGACQRQPIWLQWKGWKDNPPRGSSLDMQAIVLSHASINVALDVWMFALPLTQLIHLGLKMRKKTGVIVIFSVGIL
ncbi:hypothetical protein FSARC_10894 [Fusarium sarcochroum]|uniref:Rhodopsin domain-containing protein n=1 Tax=Fusarium sarcochroum TaxID=1208366 RepID=A0A8H4TJF9_9HYPO|nr:hypothetical protein FSARC_10894 [Fusarium sarcochroum]